MLQGPEILVASAIELSLTHTGNSFLLVAGERRVKQSTCEFLLTFSSMVATDIETYLSDLSNDSDEVRVPLSSRGEALTLSLAEFARLRNLYGQMMFELKLQDLLLRNCISSQSVPAPAFN